MSSQQKQQAPKKTNYKFDIQAVVTYVAAESRPDSGYFLFTYKISIQNKSTRPAQLISRHWVITDANNATEEVRGAGVVGSQPHIQPGQVFEYESVCPLPTPSGSMRGSYQFVSPEGDSFEIEIPEFFLIAPGALH